MRAFVTILCLLSRTLTLGQTCFCDTDSMLKEIINCDKTKFDNKAQIYWSFNCDSWLTFEGPTNKKEVIFSLGEGLQIYTERLGYSFAQEYNDMFLIQNRVIFGCCAPSDFYLFDKTTGQLKSNLGILIFYSQTKNLPFAISLTNSSYDTTYRTDNNSLTVYNLEKNKTYNVKLPKGEIDKAMKTTEVMYPEYLFDEPILKGTTIYLTYLLNKPKSEKARNTRTITIDLNKYNH